LPPADSNRPSSPMLCRRRLALELRQLREEAGLTLEQVAERLFCSMSKISRIETARVTATVRDVRDLLDLYAVEGQQHEDLLRLARLARQKGPWWHAFKGVHDARTFFELEGFAVSISIYECLLIPGLLQTRAYVALILASAFPDLSPQEVERLVELRLLRQSTLTGDDAPSLEVVIDEAALHRLVGGPQVMGRQLHHLVEAAEMPNVTFQVLPFIAGEHGGMAGPFTILRFPEDADRGLGYLEPRSGELYLDRPDHVDAYERLFRSLQARAMTPDASISFTAELARRLGC
jgi:transcriptional regulator with XRE-family HTH domain